MRIPEKLKKDASIYGVPELNCPLVKIMNQTIQMVFRSLFLFLLLSFTFTGCLEEESEPSIILAGQVLYVSGQRVTLSGTLHTYSESATDYGFWISETESFDDPIVLSLGKPGLRGVFAAEYQELEIGTEYFFLAYIEEPGGFITSQPKTFTTFKPSIRNFTPSIASFNDLLIINGSNFTEETKVFFGNSQATVNSISLESRMEVRVPNVSDQRYVDIKVVTGSDTLTFEDQFEYVTGVWTRVGQFPSSVQVEDGVVFETNEHVYIGFGKYVRQSDLNSEFWRLNKETLLWESVPTPATNPVQGPVSFQNGFSSGRIGFFNGTFLYSQENWTVNDAGEWVLNGQVPFSRYKSISTAMLGYEYVFGGRSNNSETSNYTFRGITENNQWEVVSQFPPPIDISSDNASFTYNDEFYYMDAGFAFWKFNPEVTQWSQVSTQIPAGVNAFAEVIGDQVYIGLGLNSTTMFVWDLNTNTVGEKNPFIGHFSESNIAHWTHNGKIYVLRTVTAERNDQLPNMEIWELDPNAIL